VLRAGSLRGPNAGARRRLAAGAVARAHGARPRHSVLRMPQLLHLLYYDYGDDIVTRRAAHREAHLAYLADWHADGRLLLGGAVGNPPDRGVLVFAIEDPAAVEAFAAQDPYVVNGLVTAWRVEPWTEVVAAGT